jgi:hypothetical protein
LAQHFYDIQNNMFFVLGSLNAITNIACCVIMGLFINLIKRITIQIRLDGPINKNNILTRKVTINSLVTGLHMTFIIVYTVVIFVDEITYPFLSPSA